MNYKRIAVVGISGAGKSIFSRQLKAKTGLPVFHMDMLFWKWNWEEVPEADYLREHKALIEKEEWIIEGYVDKTMSDRLAKADLVLYLDYGGLRCAWRVLCRWWKHRKESRPELPEEALEHFDLKFLWLVLTRGERKNIEEAILSGNPAIVKRFTSPKELGEYVKIFR